MKTFFFLSLSFFIFFLRLSILSSDLCMEHTVRYNSITISENKQTNKQTGDLMTSTVPRAPQYGSTTRFYYGVI